MTINHQVEAVNLVENGQLQGSVNVALFLVTPHMDAVLVRAAIHQLVNQPGIAVEVEDYRLVRGEQGVEVPIVQAVGVLPFGHQLEQVYHVDEAHLQVGELLPQNGGCRPGIPWWGCRRSRPSPHRGYQAQVPQSSLLAQSQMPMPLVQCSMALSMGRYCRCFCLSETMTLM